MSLRGEGSSMGLNEVVTRLRRYYRIRLCGGSGAVVMGLDPR